MGQYKAKGAHFASLVSIGGSNESIELELGQILAFSGVCEQIPRHLFTIETFQARVKSDLTSADNGAIIDIMAQLIVRNLEDDIRDKLRALATEHGRSMEEEVRMILRTAALRSCRKPTTGLGTRLAERFKGCNSQDGEIEELRGSPPQAAEFNS